LLQASSQKHIYVAWKYTEWSKTDSQIYFWDNFGNSAPILTMVPLLQAEIYGA